MFDPFKTDRRGERVDRRQIKIYKFRILNWCGKMSESEIQYFWFTGFEWCVHEPQVFQIFVREYFGDDDIPEN